MKQSNRKSTTLSWSKYVALVMLLQGTEVVQASGQIADLEEKRFLQESDLTASTQAIENAVSSTESAKDLLAETSNEINKAVENLNKEIGAQSTDQNNN